MSTGRGSGPIVVVIGRYPLVTTTFIDREIAALRRRGIAVDVIALRRPPDDMPLSAEQRVLRGEAEYVLPVRWGELATAHLSFLLTAPREYLGAFGFLLTRRHPSFRAWIRTVLHFGEGVVVAQRLRGRAPRELYAHFADRAAVVALVAGRLLGCPYSLSIHAGADLFVHPVLLREKIEEARCVVTCTAANRAAITAIVGRALGDKVMPVLHGLPLAQYRPRTAKRDGDGIPLVLAVGQLREKKGFAELVAACALLRERGVRFRCRIVGEGPQRDRLECAIRDAGLGEVVDLAGALPHDEVVSCYARASAFVMPCITTPDGQVDGIPNVVPEAMAMGLPIVSSDLPALRELVTDEVDGLLVPPGDGVAVAAAVERLLTEPGLAARIGAAGREVVLRRFDVEANVDHLVRVLWPEQRGDVARLDDRIAG